MKPLSKRQSEVLDIIAAMTRESGCSPTIRELGERLGLRSTCTVQRYLEVLERKGYLRRLPGKARRITLLGDWSSANTVHVIGGQISSFRDRNYVRIEGAKYRSKDDGHLMEFDLLRRLGMADEENGRVFAGRLCFESDAPSRETPHE